MRLTGRRRAPLLVVLAIMAIGAVSAAAYLASSHPSSTAAPLPSWCVKPKGGYLIVANLDGYNGSKDHNVAVGNAVGSWPIISVSRGANVTITVCNTDTTEAHGFQVRYYYDNRIVAVSPGKSLTVSFLADQKGSFAIYCGIFCTVHIFMQSGKLVVS